MHLGSTVVLPPFVGHQFKIGFHRTIPVQAVNKTLLSDGSPVTHTLANQHIYSQRNDSNDIISVCVKLRRDEIRIVEKVYLRWEIIHQPIQRVVARMVRGTCRIRTVAVGCGHGRLIHGKEPNRKCRVMAQREQMVDEGSNLCHIDRL